MVVKRRELQQRIARTGDHRHAAIPQLDSRYWEERRSEAAARLAFWLSPASPRAAQSWQTSCLWTGVHLVDIDVRDFVMLREIEACVVALITLHRPHVAAAQDVVREENIDETLDIERDARAGVSWIDA